MAYPHSQRFYIQHIKLQSPREALKTESISSIPAYDQTRLYNLNAAKTPIVITYIRWQTFNCRLQIGNIHGKNTKAQVPTAQWSKRPQ